MFLKGRNIGSNIRLIMDVIEYTECNETPGAILLLDIEKAFHSVNHDFLLQVLKYFNFRDNFISWVNGWQLAKMKKSIPDMSLK